jgi:hypothetical protein
MPRLSRRGENREALPDRRGIPGKAHAKGGNDMDDRTTENTNDETEQNTFLDPWITIEAAASRIVLGRIVKGEEWRENEKIQEIYKALYNEAYKVEEYLQDPMTLGDVFEWVKNNIHIAEEIMTKYPDERHQDLIEGLMAAIKRIFGQDVYIHKTFREIYSGLHTEYGFALVCNETVTDLETNTGYKYPEKDKNVKTAREIFTITKNAILAEADKFGLLPEFTPDEEAETDYFYFHPVTFRPNTPKGRLEIKTEGITAWLKYNKIHDEYYNPATERPETKITDTPKPAAASGNEGRQDETVADTSPSAAVQEPVGWAGNASDLADLIGAIYDAKFIKANNLTTAFRLMAPHFFGVNTDPEVLRKSYLQRKGSGNNKFQDIKPGSIRLGSTDTPATPRKKRSNGK